MADLDTAIRAKLAEIDDSMGSTGSLWGAEEMRGAIEAVLDLHRAVQEGFTHIDESAYEAARRWALEETVRVIAGKLGVEVDRGGAPI